MLKIDANSSRELQAVILSIRQADREIQKQIRQQTKGAILGEWQSSLAQHAETRLEHKVLVQTARVKVSNQNVTLTAAGSVKKLSKGSTGTIKSLAAAVEFGADRSAKTTYSATSSKGKRYKVTRRTRAQLRDRNRKGYVVYPTAAEMIPRFAALWTQTTVRTMYEALEKKG